MQGAAEVLLDRITNRAVLFGIAGAKIQEPIAKRKVEQTLP